MSSIPAKQFWQRITNNESLPKFKEHASTDLGITTDADVVCIFNLTAEARFQAYNVNADNVDDYEDRFINNMFRVELSDGSVLGDNVDSCYDDKGDYFYVTTPEILSKAGLKPGSGSGF